MTRKSAKQVLACATLGGFIALSALVMLGYSSDKVELVFGAWVALTTKVMSDYFGEYSTTHDPDDVR
jgi:hypothetical protein